MADCITRTIPIYKAEAFRVSWREGKPFADKLGEAEFYLNGTKTAARKALKAAGVDCPRGTEITITEIGEKHVTIPMDVAMQYID